MRGFGTFGLSLAELAINLLAAVFVILAGSIALAKHESREPEICPEPRRPEDRDRERLLPVLNEEVAKLESALIEADKRLASCRSSIAPNCAGGPLFSVIAEGADRFRTSEDLVLSALELADLHRKELEVARKLVPGCVHRVTLLLKNGLPAEDVVAAHANLIHHFRIARLDVESH